MFDRLFSRLKRIKRPWLIMAAVCVCFLLINIVTGLSSDPQDVSYSEFLSMIVANVVESAEIGADTVIFSAKAGVAESAVPWAMTSRLYRVYRVDDPYLVERLSNAGVTFGAEATGGVSIIVILLNLASFAFYGLMIWWIYKMIKGAKQKGGGMSVMGFGKSSVRQYQMSEIKTRFRDVEGQEEAKASLIELVDILNRPEKYTSVGAQLPKGALLVGPPGTGKTMLAKAVAGEANRPFFFVSGSSFVEMFVGTCAARVRDLFKQAAEKAPCIVFIDEIDAIGKRRDVVGVGGNDEREQTLNQLLAEMDGFDPGKGIIVLAATNRPEVLDQALTRPGRFDRRIPVELPDLKGREGILRVHAKGKPIDPEVDLKEIARATAGSSGADLANIVNEAALAAVRGGRNAITQKDFDAAAETVIAGDEKKSMVISEQDRKMIAYHEIGHALVAALQKNPTPIRKITIIPRTSGALGFTMQADAEQRVLMTREDLESRLEVLTAGRAAEEIAFGTCTTGAANDIEQATHLARNMVTRYGMSEKMGFMTLDAKDAQYLYSEARPACSEDTSARVDEEIRLAIENAYRRAAQMLRENIGKLNELSDCLLSRESMSGDEFMAIINKGGFATEGCAKTA